MPDSIHVPVRARTMIQQWEGFENEVYEDVVGVPTIGYGFTAPALERIGEPMPETITQGKAAQVLDRLLEEHYAPKILSLVDAPLLSNQLGALCSFCYNVGIGAFAGSTLRRKLNEGKEEEAEEEFARWVYAGGEVYKGLVKRRADERRYFEKDEREVPEEEIEPVPVRKVEPLPWEETMTLDSLIDNVGP